MRSCGRRPTLDEEDVCGSILLTAVKVSDDALDILGSGHENVHGLEAGLLVSVRGDGFYYCVRTEYTPSFLTTSGLTCNILLKDVELLEDGVEELLRVFVDDEDLPSRRRIH